MADGEAIAASLENAAIDGTPARKSDEVDRTSDAQVESRLAAQHDASAGKHASALSDSALVARPPTKPRTRHHGSGGRKILTPTEATPAKPCNITNGMLHEFKRLGKVRESDLKLCLNRLASLSVLPGGIVRHSEKIVDLTEQIMLTVRGGQATAGENARRMLKWSPQFSAAWRNVNCLNLPQVLQLYAAGADDGTHIDIGLPGHAGAKLMSLQRYSQMDRTVYLELFVRSVDEIRQHLPKALGRGPVPQAVRERITEIASKAAVHACAVHICTACTGLLHWNKVKPSQANSGELAFAWDALAVDPARRAEIRRVWQQAVADAAPELAVQESYEAELRRLLAAHDSTSHESFHGIVALVKQLIHSYEKQRGILASATMYIFYTVLTPYEFGILSTVQLPRTSVQQIVRQRTYPFAQPGRLVELDLV